MATKKTELLFPDYSNTGDILLKKQNTLRALVGVLGMLLPIGLYLFLQIDSGFSSVLPSISHYYYTRSCGVFIICVSALAIFLLVYKGEEPQDYYSSSLAGIFAILVLLFPTNNLVGGEFGETYVSVNVTKLKVSDFRAKFHYLSAAIFLLSLAYMSFFLFTKSDVPPSKRGKGKVIRNRIFRTCSILIVCAMCIMLFGGFFEMIPPIFYKDHCLTFWMEVVSIEVFGFSWMIKGAYS